MKIRFIRHNDDTFGVQGFRPRCWPAYRPLPEGYEELKVEMSGPAESACDHAIGLAHIPNEEGYALVLEIDGIHPSLQSAFEGADPLEDLWRFRHCPNCGAELS